MRLDYLLRSRLSRSLRDPFSLVFIVLAVVVSVAAGRLAQDKAQAVLSVAVIDEDGGGLSRKLIGRLSEYDSFSIKEMSYDDAMRLLRQDRLEAAVVICSDFSEKVQKGEFENTIELLTSPSSQAPATISEPVINSAMMLWMEELSTVTAGDYLIEHGIGYGAYDEAAQRADIQRLWQNGSAVNVRKINLDESAEAETPGGPFETCVKWYCVLCMFYLIVGASWVLDINKRALRIRIGQMGTARWKVVAVSSLAPLAISLIGYIAAGTACALLTGTGMEKLPLFFLPVCLYLFGLLGMTLLAASLLSNILSLMFIAPVLTFLSGVLSGLVVELPGWAYVLKALSFVLPGRWLGESMSSPFGYLHWALICGLAWMGAGIIVSALRSRRSSV